MLPLDRTADSVERYQPTIAPVLHRSCAIGVQQEPLAPLGDLQGVGIDPRYAVLCGFPGGPPVAGEVEVVGLLSCQLTQGDLEGVGERDRSR